MDIPLHNSRNPPRLPVGPIPLGFSSVSGLHHPDFRPNGSQPVHPAKSDLPRVLHRPADRVPGLRHDPLLPSPQFSPRRLYLQKAENLPPAAPLQIRTGRLRS